jgi:hypothetical protein
MHIGNVHDADLGDGAGRTPEALLARQSYFPRWGTCWESAVGGNHFRAWRQASSRAWFLGASKEKDGSKRHTIVPDGYNIGRNLTVEKAAAGSNYRGMWWQADVEWRAGLLEPGAEGAARSAVRLLPTCSPIRRREPRNRAGRPRCHTHHPPVVNNIHCFLTSLDDTSPRLSTRRTCASCLPHFNLALISFVPCMSPNDRSFTT